MIRAAWLPLIASLLGACSSAPVRIDSRALGNQDSQSADRFIIVAVESTPAAYVARAGATPHGYDAVVEYGPTVGARRAMLAADPA